MSVYISRTAIAADDISVIWNFTNNVNYLYKSISRTKKRYTLLTNSDISVYIFHSVMNEIDLIVSRRENRRMCVSNVHVCVFTIPTFAKYCSLICLVSNVQRVSFFPRSSLEIAFKLGITNN